MTTLRTLKKLLLGETWALPIGLAITLTAAATFRSLAPTVWSHLGGPALATAVLIVLYGGVARSDSVDAGDLTDNDAATA